MSETATAIKDLPSTRIAEYVGGSKGGIPEFVFQPGFEACVKGLSNETSPQTHKREFNLECFVSKTQVHIHDVDDNYFVFNAWFENIPVNSTREVLKLNINNSGWHDNSTERYPDIYPSALLERTLRFFAQQGHDVKYIQGHWIGIFARSDNHKAYTDALKQTGKPFDPETKNTIAQNNTWTGQELARFGYKVISVDDSDPNDVYVMFEKIDDNAVVTLP